jgi:serine phosphatase RsbU (regulator of sigma subunit)
VAAIDIGLDPDRPTVTGLTSLAPLLAATTLRSRSVWSYAAAAMLMTVALGLYYELSGLTSVLDVPQLTRYAAVAAAGVLAVQAGRARERREHELLEVTGIAAQVQRAILPPLPDRVGDVRLAGAYRSASRGALVGGDLYDAVQTPWGVRLLVGDVRGKGLEAVRLTSLVLGAFRALAPKVPELPQLLAALDGVVAEASQHRGADVEDEDFVTAALLEIDGQAVSVVSAGHPAPVVCHSGRAEQLDLVGTCPPLGLMSGSAPDLTTLQLPGPSRLLLFTDGIAEARRPSDNAWYPLERLGPLLLAGQTTRDVVEVVFADVVEWAGGALGDDVALLVAELTATEVIDVAPSARPALTPRSAEDGPRAGLIDLLDGAAAPPRSGAVRPGRPAPVDIA